MHLIIALLVTALMALTIQGSADAYQRPDILARDEPCSPFKAGDCSSCGADYLQCGFDFCYNPNVGETCCPSQDLYPEHSVYSPSGGGCVFDDGSHGHGQSSTFNANSTSSVVALATTCGSLVSPTSPDAPIWTMTITSTTISTVTISATSSSHPLNGSWTPSATSLGPFGNSTSMALNTLASTSTASSPSTSISSIAVAPNIAPTTTASNTAAVNPTATSSGINPPTSGYNGAAMVLQGQSSRSLFALGFMVYTAALLV